MPVSPHDAQYERLLTRVVEGHAAASRLRVSAAAAAEALASAVRVGDAVRRAVRAGASRPDEGDCAALEHLASDLESALARAASAPPTVALRRAIDEGRPGDAARIALAVFEGLASPRALPGFAYRALRVRRRAGRGEALIHPDDLAREIAAASRAGLRVERDDGVGLPEPLVLAPSFAACSSEVALRRATADLRDALVEDEVSGDLLAFTPLAGPFSVALAAASDDEWWAASEVGYASYRAQLERALDALDVPFTVDAA